MRKHGSARRRRICRWKRARKDRTGSTRYLKSFYLDPTPAGRLEQHGVPERVDAERAVGTAGHTTRGDVVGQARRRTAHPRLEQASPGKLSAAQYDDVARDLATFLDYAGEPAKLKREAMGVWVVLYLAFFTFIAWLLKHEYWKDVH